MRRSVIAWVGQGSEDFVDVTGRWIEVEAEVEVDEDGQPNSRIVSVFDLNKRQEIGEGGITESERERAVERIEERLLTDR